MQEKNCQNSKLWELNVPNNFASNNSELQIIQQSTDKWLDEVVYAHEEVLVSHKKVLFSFFLEFMNNIDKQQKII